MIITLLVTISGCAAPAPPDSLAAEPRTETIFLVERGWHTDIGLAASQPGPTFARLRETFPGVRTLLIGFGDRAYLLHRGPDFGQMLAALLPGPGALLVTALRDTPRGAFPMEDVVTLRISARGLSGLNDFVTRSFESEPGGVPRPLRDGPYPGSIFYPSGVTYSGLYTCNTWTAEALRSAGVPVRTTGVLFAHDVMDQAREIAATWR